MQEKDKNVSTLRFLTNYGDKVLGSEDWYNPEDDTTDQRAPVNNPSELYEQFFIPDLEEVMDDLEDESIEDFENDIYDYEDRSELGEDIAVAQTLDLKRSQQKLTKKQSQPKEPVDEDGEQPSEQADS